MLDTKSELQKAMEKRDRNKKDKERLKEEETKKTPFQKVLEERAKRLEMLVSTYLQIGKLAIWHVAHAQLAIIRSDHKKLIFAAFKLQKKKIVTF